MKYKIGDVLICKHSSQHNHIYVEEGKSYIITDIMPTGSLNSSNIPISSASFSYNYYKINNNYFYSKSEYDECWERLSEWVAEHPGQNSSGMSGISPSAKIEDHFYSIAEVRRLKLKRLSL